MPAFLRMGHQLLAGNHAVIGRQRVCRELQLVAVGELYLSMTLYAAKCCLMPLLNRRKRRTG